MKLTIEVRDDVAEVLAKLAAEDGNATVEEVAADILLMHSGHRLRWR